MKKVKFLVDTAYQGPRKEGEVVNVPEDYANRWIKNGIAVLYEGGAKEDDDVDETPEDEAPEETLAPETPEEVDYSEMSAKDLYSLCKDKGLDVEAKKGKEYYIEKLQG